MSPVFRASSIGKLMSTPKAKGEVLSVGAKTYIRELATQAIFGVDFEVSSRAMEKGIETEQECIDLVNQVRGLSLVKNTERITRDGLTGEADCIDRERNRGHDVKSCWSIQTFRAFDVDVQDSLYEWQARAYQALYDVDSYCVDYCMVDTPERLIGHEPMQLHLVSHIPAHLRLTTWSIERDAALEALMFQKIAWATGYYRETIASFDRLHPAATPRF